MALDDNALITLANLKIYLKVSAADYDTELEMLINMVSPLMLAEIGHNPVYATYTSIKLDGTGRAGLDIPNFPIVEATSLKENGITLTEGTDFLVYKGSGYLKRISGTLEGGYSEAKWGKGCQNIEISYKAGYWVQSEESGVDEMPKDIQLACAKQAGIEWKRAKAEDWDITAQTFPDGSISKNIQDLHPQVLSICKKYQRPRV